MTSMPTPVWNDEHTFTLDGITYSSMQDGDADLLLLKTQPMVDFYVDLVAREQPRRIFDLGIYRGGSAALLTQLADPDKLVCIDRQRTPVPALQAFIDAGRQDTMAAHYGIDQTDVEALEHIVATEFDGPLDLVIDDASHLYRPTLTSFNQLFPHLRPGGLYVVEDWAGSHDRFMGTDPDDGDSMSRLAFELTLVVARHPRMVVDLKITPYFVIARRGPADLHPGRFDLRRHLGELGTRMSEALTVAPA
jgi:predicted O-methyltransferase YrrM